MLPTCRTQGREGILSFRLRARRLSCMAPTGKVANHIQKAISAMKRMHVRKAMPVKAQKLNMKGNNRMKSSSSKVMKVANGVKSKPSKIVKASKSKKAVKPSPMELVKVPQMRMRYMFLLCDP